MAPFLLLNLLGCTSPFEGTWLFLAERQQKVSGDCADPDDETRYTGTSNSFVDIFKLDSGEFLVLYGEYLVGTAEGSSLQASWDQVYTDEDYEESEGIELEATLDGSVLSGTVTESSRQASGDDEYRCSVETTFSAERTVSSPDSYPDN